MSVNLYEVHRIAIPGAQRAVATREVLVGTFDDESAAFAQVQRLTAERAGETRAQKLARSLHPVFYRVRSPDDPPPPTEAVPRSAPSVSRKRP